MGYIMKSISKLMSLKNRVALVSGATGNIGRHICATLAEMGANLVITDLSEEKCSLLANDISAKYSNDAFGISADLSIEKEICSIPDIVRKRFEKIDILVNCAAFVGTSNLEGWTTDFLGQKSETWRAALEVNLTAPFVLAQACTPLMKRSKNAAIVNICSIYGLVGPDLRLYAGTDMGNPAAYAASKGGLIQLTRWLATVLAPDIRVNAISLGGVFRDQPAAFHKKYLEKTPLKRMAVEEDIKGAVAYLTSDMSSYVTGHNLIVDGGWTVW